jgi:hypothetical protein
MTFQFTNVSGRSTEGSEKGLVKDSHPSYKDCEAKRFHHAFQCVERQETRSVYYWIMVDATTIR